MTFTDIQQCCLERDEPHGRHVCMVVGCEREGAVITEPIYAAKVDRPFASENMVVCASQLCREHAGLLSWSI